MVLGNSAVYKIFLAVVVALTFSLLFSSCKAKNSDEVINGQGGYETPIRPIFSDSEVASNDYSDSLIDDGEFHIEDFMASPETESLPAEDGDDLGDLTEPVEDASAVVLPSSDTLMYTSYRVKEGDMIGVLAEQFNLTSDTIISVNSIKQSRLIQIGQYLKIPTMPGILYTVRSDDETVLEIAKKYEVDSAKCALVNHVAEDQGLTAGTMLFVPDGELDWVTRQEINGDLFLRPLHGGYYFSSYFGWRNSPFTGARTYHNGIDMAVPTGTKVYAALTGTVTTAGWSNTYGNYVVVTHHSGYKTLYGHMSAIKVTKNQIVYTSTVLGLVGSTGMSTGPHLHFTIYKNGVAVNPQNLWK